METHFVTFANAAYRKTAERLLKEAQAVFDECKILSEQDLRFDYWKATEPYCYAKRGYGYWLWKPYLLYNAMQTMKEGDILIYADAGCTIQHHHEAARQKLEEYYALLQQDNHCCIRFQLGQDCVEHYYTTTRLKLALDATEEDLLNHQFLGGILLFKVCDASRSLLQQWYEMCMLRPDLFSDVYNSEAKLFDSEFRDHRHDQSVFSLLTKRELRNGVNIAVVQDDTLVCPRNRDSPILATRIRY